MDVSFGADASLPYFRLKIGDPGVHERAYAFAKDLRDRQHWDARTRAEAGLCLYMGSTRLLLNNGTSAFLDPLEETPPYFNLIQTATDYFTSLMCRNQIRPFFLTEGGDIEARRRAEAFQQGVEGTMQALDVYGQLGRFRTMDGFLFQAGGIKYSIDYENRRIVASRVRAWECYTPEREARLGTPRSLVHAYLVDRHVLAASLPEGEERRMVEETPSEDIDPAELVMGDNSDMALVYEVWHLPSNRPDLSDMRVFGIYDDDAEEEEKDPGHDGRHLIITSQGVLLDEPWPYEYFPIAWFKPHPDPVGYWSRSVPETLAGAQLAIIEADEKEQRILDAHANPKLIVWKNSGIDPKTWDNDPRSILVSRVPPAQAVFHVVPAAVPGDLLRKKAEVTAQAEKQLGVTETSLSGQKPKGVDHAPGMEHLAEMEMIRHTSSYKAYEDAHLDDARILSDQLRALAMYLESEFGEDMEVVFQKDKQLVRVKWSEMNLAYDQYVTKLWPTDLFAKTPTAKIRQLKELYGMNAFDGSPQSNMLLRMIGAPDVDAAIGDRKAPEEAIEHLLKKCLDGKPTVEWIPTPDMDLELCTTKAAETVARLTADGEDEEVISRVRMFWDIADQWLKRNEPPPAPPAPAGPPGMAPMPAGQMPAPPGGVPVQPLQ